jgi:hypothetical protein
MKRLRLPLATLLAISSLAVIGSATTAEAATPAAVYSSASPSRPMANEVFTASWHLSTHLNRVVRLQTISGGAWKTIEERVSSGTEVGFAVHSTKTRDYRVYVPKTSRSGKVYPSFSSKAKTLHIFPQTVDAFASPLEQCGTEGERVPVILVAQFEPRREARTVTFEAVGPEYEYPPVTAKTDAAGNIAVSIPGQGGALAEFQSKITAAPYRGSAAKSVIVSYRNWENLCSWFQ